MDRTLPAREQPVGEVLLTPRITLGQQRFRPHGGFYHSDEAPKAPLRFDVEAFFFFQ